MKKILWINDYTLDDRVGGCEIDHYYLSKYFEKRGLTVETISLKTVKIKPKTTKETIANFDGPFLLSNISLIFKENPEVIRNIILSKPFIKIEHGHAWLEKKIDDETLTEIFNRAKGVIFFSPLQYENHLKHGIKTENFIITPPYFEDIDFKNPLIGKVYNTGVYAGFVSRKKGILNIIKYARDNPEKKIDLFGKVDEFDLLRELPPNVSYKGIIDHQELLNILKSYQFAIHLPEIDESFCRFLAEAYIYDLEIITNKRIGFFSYPWDFKEREFVVDELIRGKENIYNFIEKVFFYSRQDLVGS